MEDKVRKNGFLEDYDENEKEVRKKAEKAEKARERILTALAQGRVKSLPQQVAYILNQYPDARNSDKFLTVNLIKLSFLNSLIATGKYHWKRFSNCQSRTICSGIELRYRTIMVCFWPILS
jgi:hypothetical protein